MSETSKPADEKVEPTLKPAEGKAPPAEAVAPETKPSPDVAAAPAQDKAESVVEPPETAKADAAATPSEPAKPVAEEPPRSTPADASAHDEPPPTPLLRRPVVWIGAVLVVALVAGGAWMFLGGKKKKPRGAEPQTAAGPATAGDQAAKAESKASPAAAPAPAPAQPAAQPAPPAPPAPAPEPPKAAPEPPKPVDPETAAFAEAKTRAEAGDVGAMEEVARRYLRGAGVARNDPEGARWLTEAANRGSATAQFNVGVMFERGFTVAQDYSQAAAWYARASAGGVPMAIHNLALLYRDGNGVPKDEKRAFDLMLDAARRGLSASMYMIAGAYDRAEFSARKDLVAAISWYALAKQFEEAQTGGQPNELTRRAQARIGELQKTLPLPDLQRADKLARTEYDRIVANIRNPQPPQAQPPQAQPSPPQQAGAAPPPMPPAKPVRPTAAKDLLIEIQKMLFALNFYKGASDGVMGPGTRAAIRSFQEAAGLKVTGEPSAELYDELAQTLEMTTGKR